MIEKFRVEITLLAERDIEEIWSFIAADSLIEAARFIGKLEEQVSTLERLPLRCPLIPENEILGTVCRHLLYGNYRTIFRVEDGSVYVLRIIHGGKLLDTSMFGI